MASDGQTESRKSRRTSNACVACRQSKIKCSGHEPCANCERRALRCLFVEGSSKVVVTERYLHQLQRQAKEHQQWKKGSPGSKRSAEAAFGPLIEGDGGGNAEAPLSVRFNDRVNQDEALSQSEDSLLQQMIDPGRSVWISPFTPPSRTIKNTYKNKPNWIWLAPTSLWSFTVRLSLMMTEKLRMESPYTAPNSLDREIYPLHWRHGGVDVPLDISGLPSIDHALYLFNTVKFHLDSSYRFFEEEAFLAHVHEFYYGDALRKASECRLWFVQFLLVLAFGNAFLLQSRDPKGPPGSKFFVRAMSLMPDHASLWKEGLLAVEVLALCGLYLYCIDHREAAHVGQAIRIAQMDGLHTELPEDELGAVTVTRCRNLWWTLYVMDRHFSSSLGVPMTTQDSDITTLVDPPTACSQQDATLSLQVGLSHLLSFILTSIYKTEKTELGPFLQKTRSILQTLAGHAQTIENIIHTKFQNSVDTMPRGTRHITLLYHQCVIVATRPLLLSVLKERLGKLGQGDEDWPSLLAPTKALISTGIKSASKTLQILTDEDSFLEVFLPFELEFTYAAGIHLTMANTLFPHASDGQSYSKETHLILDEMIYKGNRLAGTRKEELGHLEGLFRELEARIERRGLQTLTLTSPEQNVTEAGNTTNPSGEQQDGEVVLAADQETVPLSEPGDCSQSIIPQTPRDLEVLDNIGISSYDFLSLVNQMGSSENYVLDSVGGPC
ncbi:putative transcription factor [Aspergillus sp. HF37]|nr:putative transcription factor [Aspergillus sp. HF37]